MKINCKAIKLAIGIIIIAFFLSLVCFGIGENYLLGNTIVKFCENICVGIFCSTLVTLFFYISNYKIEKEKLLTKFWDTCYKLIFNLNKVTYLETVYDRTLLLNFIKEKESDKWIIEYNKTNPEVKLTEQHEEKDKLLEHIIKIDAKYLNKASDNIKQFYAEDTLKNIEYRIYEIMNSIIDSYMEICEFSAEELKFMLGEMEFFRTDKKYFEDAYEIYSVINDLYSQIHQITQTYFKLYVDDGRGFVKTNALAKILEFQDLIFEIDENENEIKIYNKFFYNTLYKLEEFRAKVIQKDEVKHAQRQPIKVIRKREY